MGVHGAPFIFILTVKRHYGDTVRGGGLFLFQQREGAVPSRPFSTTTSFACRFHEDEEGCPLLVRLFLFRRRTRRAVSVCFSFRRRRRRAAPSSSICFYFDDENGLPPLSSVCFSFRRTRRAAPSSSICFYFDHEKGLSPSRLFVFHFDDEQGPPPRCLPTVLTTTRRGCSPSHLFWSRAYRIRPPSCSLFFSLTAITVTRRGGAAPSSSLTCR